MSQNSKPVVVSGGSGIGFFGALFLVFLILKLCGVIDWSWCWVTAPLWGPFAAGCTILLAIIILFALFVFLAAIFKD